MKIFGVLSIATLMVTSCQESPPRQELHHKAPTDSRSSSGSTLRENRCGEGPVRFSGNTSMPRAVRRIVPNLDKCDFQQAGITVRITVGVHGDVLHVELTEPATECINEAVLKAYRNASYCPAERAGKPIEMTVDEHLELRKMVNLQRS